MDEMRDGRYDVKIPSIDRDDEIGVMARATASFRDNLIRMEAVETEQKKSEARQVSRSHLTRPSKLPAPARRAVALQSWLPR